MATVWPTSGTTPYGTCDGGNSEACSYQYGWERAQNSVTAFFLPAARAAIKPLGEDAAERTWQAVLEADAERKSIHDADLAPDDF